MNKGNPRADIFLGIGLILFSAIVYWASLDLPEPEYEPLGSAALPQALALFMSLLSIVVIIRAVNAIRRQDKPADIPGTQEITPRPLLAVAVFGLTVAFVASLDFEILTFIPAGIIYLTAIGYLMTHRNLKRLPYVMFFSVVLTLSTFYAFTKIFYIDLP
jgi:putative tricarboxylic transport membrane protein